MSLPMKSSGDNKLNVSKCFAAACVGMAFFGITMVTLGSLLPALSAKLALTAAEQTTLAGTLSVGILTGSLIFGPVCDRYGHKALQLTSSILVMLGLLGLTIFGSFLPVAISVYIIGTGGGVLNGQTNALVPDLYEGSKCNSRLSLLGAFYGVGAIAITLVFYLFMKNNEFEPLTWAVCAVMLCCIIYCAMVEYPKPKQPQSFPIGKAFNLLTDGALLLLSLVLFFESGIEMVTNTWSTTFFTRSGLVSPETAILSLSVMVLALTLGRFVLAYLLSKFNAAKILLGCFVLLLCGFGAMYLATDGTMVMLAMVLIGVGTASTYPIVLASIGKRYPALTGTAFGVAMTISLIGNTLINSTMGSVIGSDNLNIFPVLMMACVVVMAILFMAGNGKVERDLTTK